MQTTTVAALGATFAAASLLPFAIRRVAPGQNWFHPVLMPVAYLSLVLLAPLAYVVATQRGVAGVQPGDVSLVLVCVLALTVAGFVAGVLTSLRFVEPAAEETIPRSWSRVLLCGRAMLVIAIAMRTYSTIRGWGTPYGTGSVNFGTSGTLQTLTDFLSVTGPALVVLAQVRLRGAVAAPLDAVLFGVFCVMTLVAGSRGELLVPVIFALWVHHRNVSPISPRAVVIGCLAVAILFQAVQGARAGESPLTSPRDAIERTLTSVGVPMQVTSLTAANVPSQADHLLGKTYYESLARQLPGALAVSLWGPPRDTGTFALRRIVGFDSLDAGLGFALPAESYLNYGVAGALFIALLVGLLFGYAYQKQAGADLSRASHALYGFLIATLPLSLRADAVLQIKSVLYPMIATTIVLGLCRLQRPEPSGSRELALRRTRILGRR
ncbi:MAG TPA: O-antigen polymerase [Solirubrobacteraceae bacterium]|nr:O-antigen polymerase [Solirubrobacteraceae bacterium]